MTRVRKRLLVGIASTCAILAGVLAPASAAQAVDPVPPPGPYSNYPVPENQRSLSTAAVEDVPDACSSWAPASSVPAGLDYTRVCNEAVRVAPTFEAQRAIRYGFGKLGTLYSQGADRETTKFDCSSFVARAFRAADGVVRTPSGALVNFYPYFSYTGAYMPSAFVGTNVQRVAQEYNGADQLVTANLQPGDLIIMFDGSNPANSAGNNGHAQMYLGNGYVIHAGSAPTASPSQVSVKKFTGSGFSSAWVFRYRSLGAERTTDSKVLPDGAVTKVHVGRANETVMGNMTVTGGLWNGFTTAYPCGGTVPEASVNNYARGQSTPNMAVVRADANGDVCVRNSVGVHVLWDQVWNGLDLTAHPAQRIVDTRSPSGPTSGARVPAGGVLSVDTKSPNKVVMANLTVTGPADGGFTTVYPCTAGMPVDGYGNPNASTNNYLPGETTPNLVTVQADEWGRVCIHTKAATHLLWDQSVETDVINGHSPERVYDSRRDNGGRVAGAHTAFVHAGQPGQTIFGNLTVTDPESLGYTSVYPCLDGIDLIDGRPTTSVNNYTAGETTPNAAAVRADSNGDICITTTATAHLIWDQVGEADGLRAYPARRLLDTRVAGTGQERF